jgi:hypothetical protein
MARANCLPTAVDSIGVEYAPRALGWIISAGSLQLPFQTIDIRRIDRTMAEHNVRSQGECALYSFDHAQKRVGKAGGPQHGRLCGTVMDREEKGYV